MLLKHGMKVALIVDCWLKPRCIKIGRALRKKGISVIVIANKSLRPQIKTSAIFYDDVFYYGENDYSEFLTICNKAHANIYHVISEAHINDRIEKLMSDDKRMGAVVFDQYDHYRGFVTEREDGYAKRERFCIENADGICKRNFEAEFLKKEILFFDCCWGEEIQTEYFRDNGDKRLKIVYGGRLLRCDVQMQDYYTNLYKIERAGYRFVSKMMDTYGGIFVIIPTVDISKQGYSEYRNLKRLYPSVIIKKPMNTEDLIRYESGMDYGIDCVDLEWAVNKYDGTLTGLIREHTYYATNKFFDYLDAGIMPIYGRKYEKFGKYLEDNGAAVYCTLDDMENKLDFLKENRVKYKEQAVEAKHQFSIDSQIDRLIDFYRKCESR